MNVASISPYFRIQRELRPESRSHFSPEELLPLFKQRCEEIDAHFSETTTSFLESHLLSLFEKLDTERVIVSSDPRNLEFGLERLSCERGWHIWDAEIGEKNIGFAEQAAIGLTIADMTLADSATLVLQMDEKKSPALSLIPLVHVVLVPLSSLVLSSKSASKKIHGSVIKNERFASFVSLITAPLDWENKEPQLVCSVHAPKVNYFIVVSDK